MYYYRNLNGRDGGQHRDRWWERYSSWEPSEDEQSRHCPCCGAALDADGGVIHQQPEAEDDWPGRGARRRLA